MMTSVIRPNDSVPSPSSDDRRGGPVIGVLAVQGDFAEHLRMLSRVGAVGIEVRTPEDLELVDALIIPGGESTAIGKLLARYGLDVAIVARASGPSPTHEDVSGGDAPPRPPLAVWGTCAGMILLSRDIGDSGSKVVSQPLLGLMDLTVRRNAFGNQLDSFETDLDAPAVSAGRAVHAVFIRAPLIDRAGDGVEILARLADGRPVAARQGHLLATAFHPELTDDLSFHRYFVERVVAAQTPSGQVASPVR